jgi:glycerol-3-phosphate dehydrogenase
MAIAEHARALLTANGLVLEPSPDLPRPPRMPNIGEAFERPYQRADLIAQDPEYGAVVCFCERVTRGEIRDAMRSPIPPSDVDGLRRRTRAMMGRCQGFFCGAEVDAMLNEGAVHEQ